MDKYQQLREDKYQEFLFTLNQCGKFLLNASDDKIGECIFEEFVIGIRADAHDDNLEMYIDEGWIDEEIREKSVRLRELFSDVEFNHPEIFNVESVRTSEVWREILNLADEIKELLYY